LGAFIGELKSIKIIGRYSRGIKITVAAFLGIALIFAAQNHKVLTDHMDFYGQRSGNLEETGQWMGKNLPPGKIIYHSYWDASSYFMCFNAGGYYINGLDPIYMYWRHKKEFELIDELMLGHIDKPEKVFNSVFKAEYGFVGIGEPLYCQIRNDPIHFEILYTNPGGLIFKTIPPKT
jgi:hypothetical protein